MTPRLMPCRSSPPAGNSSTMNMSTMSATAVSDWPTPTVSTISVSKPAASASSMASRVRRATPPKVAPAGEGRMKAAWRRDSSSIRVLSPRIEPPPRLDEGSMASTASERPRSSSDRPKRSMKVDLPTPGTPVMPSRTDLPVCGNTAASNASARSRWSVRVDSISVMAWASARRSPASNGARRGSALSNLATWALMGLSGLSAPPVERQQRHDAGNRIGNGERPAEAWIAQYIHRLSGNRPSDQAGKDVEHAEGGIGAGHVTGAETLAEEGQPHGIDRKGEAAPQGDHGDDQRRLRRHSRQHHHQ